MRESINVRVRESPVLVGRRSELERLKACLDTAATGTRVCVAIRGEAGIGKSRLVREFLKGAELDAVSLVGKCAQEVPLSPLSEAFRHLAHQLDPGVLAAILGPGRGELVKFAPELGGDPASSADIHEPSVFEHVLGLITRLSESVPVIFGIEDLHFADEATIGLVQFLVRNLPDARIVLLVTARSDERNVTERLGDLYEQMKTVGGEFVDLVSLDSESVTELLRERSGASIGDELAADIFHKSDGNPLFCELLQDEVLLGVPLGERDVVLARILDRLSPDAREVVDILAITGIPTSEAFIGRLLEHDESHVVSLVDEGLEAEVLARGESGIWFRHDLFRDATLADLLPTERAQLHARVATALAESAAGDPQGLESLGIRIAAHWQEAGDRPAAACAAIDAAVAVERVSPADALLLYERSLHLARRLPAWPYEAMSLGQVLARAGETAFECGDVTYASELVRRALTTSVADATLSRSLLLEHLGRYAKEGGSLESAHYFEEAYRALSDNDPPSVRARVLASVGLARVASGTRASAASEGGIELIAEARNVSAQTRDRALEAAVLNDLADAYLRSGQLSLAVDLAREARIAGEGANSPHQVIVAFGIEARATYRRTGNLDDSIALRRDGFRVAEQFGQVQTAGADIRIALLEDLIEYGAWAEAEEFLRTMPAGDSSSLNATDGLLAKTFLSLRRGTVVDQPLHLAELVHVPDANSESYFLSLAIPIAAAASDLALVRRFSTRLIELCDEVTPVGALYLTDAFAAAIAAEADSGVQEMTGRSTRVEALLTSAERAFRLGRPCVEADVEFTDGVIQVARAEARRSHGDTDSSMWDEPVHVFRATHAHGRLAYALLRQAEMRVRQGAKGRSRTKLHDGLEEAHTLTLELGANPWRAEVERLAHESNIQLSSMPKSDVPISKRELEVLTLVAEGLTNKAIAAQLFVTVKTIDAHLNSIFRKLGVHTRTAAVACFRESNWTSR